MNPTGTNGISAPTKMLRQIVGYGLVLALAFSWGCASGGDAPEETAPAEEEAAAEEAPAESTEDMAMGDGAPRAFFISPGDGDTVTSPVSMEFGIENYQVEPITDPETVNEGFGHMHIGVNTECMEPGIVIPKADPWIHFGDGSMVIEMQLPPGETTLVLQVGDGEHRTLDEPGLCQAITVTVEE